jgi:outer membrane receptor protein involved in Fe transport
MGPVAEVEVGAGSFDTRSARGFVGVGDGDNGGGLALDYQGSAGDFSYQHAGGTAWESGDGATVTRDHNAFDKVTALARGTLQVTDGVTMRLLDLMTWRRRGMPGIGLYEGSGAVLETFRHMVGGEVTVDLGWTPGATLRVLPWFSWSRSDLAVAPAGLALGGGSTRAESASRGTRMHLAVPMPLDDEDHWHLQPTATLAYRHETYEGHGVVQSPAGGERHRVAAVAEVSLDAEPLNTAMVLSGRYEGTWSRIESAPQVVAQQGSARLGLVHTPVAGTSIRANVAQGSRFPTPFELFGFTASTLGNADLLPERGWTLDAGVRHDAGWLPAGSYGAAELTGFVSWTDDLIQFVRNSQGISRPENVEAAFVAGVEAGLWGDLFSHLRLRSSLTWMHSEDRSDIVARRGKQLPYRPTWKIYARAEGYGHLAGQGEFGLALDLEHISGDVLDHANLVRNPPRLFVGASAWMELLQRQLRVAVNLRNVTDRQSVDFQGYPLPGITAMATLRWTPPLH